MERFVIEVGGAVVVFVLGKRYGASVEKEAVTVALALFARAKAALIEESNSALIKAKAEEERLVALIAKYL